MSSGETPQALAPAAMARSLSIIRSTSRNSLPVFWHMILRDPKFYGVPDDAILPVHNSSLVVSISVIPVDQLIHSLIDAELPHSILEDLEAVHIGRLQMPFLVKCPDGSRVILSLPPSNGVRLLRVERASVESEAAILQWLSGVVGGNNVSRAMEYPEQNESTTSKDRGKRPDSQRLAWSLRDYLPKLTKHGSVDVVDGPTSYNVKIPGLGVAISTLPRPLDPEERRTVEFQSGQFLRRLSLHSSPNRRFGLAGDVMFQPDPRPRFKLTPDGVVLVPNTQGFSSWSEGFHHLLEYVLHDGEIFTITLPYADIRRHFKRLRHLLDCVTRPCLVPVDIGVEGNTLVLRHEGGTETKTEAGREVVELDDGNNERTETKTETEAGRETDDRPDNGNDEQEDGKDSGSTESHGRIDVTGLREWSYFIFGDPLIASAFSQNPSPAFLRGFHSPLQEAEPGVPDYLSSPVEDREYGHVRLLLYECYHTAAEVVKEFYRGRHSSEEREMAARNKMKRLMARLEEFDDDGNPKRKRPSTETTPAKRPKSEIS